MKPVREVQGEDDDEPDEVEGYLITIMEMGPPGCVGARELLYRPEIQANSQSTWTSVDPSKDFSFQAAKDVFRSMVHCVENLHKMELMHLDIKPDNFLVSMPLPAKNNESDLDSGLGSAKVTPQ